MSGNIKYPNIKSMGSSLGTGAGADTNLDGYLDGMSLQRPELFIAVTGGEVYLDVNAVGGTNIDYYIGGIKHTLDCTTGAGSEIKDKRGSSLEFVF